MIDREQTIGRILASAETLSPVVREKTCRSAMRAFLFEQLEWGTRVHTVAKGDFPGSLERQVSESIQLLLFAERCGALDRSGVKAADIGSGYGFPGLVWKIIRPDIDLSLFERKEKAALFLERTIRKLRLSGITVEGEAEAYSDNGQFDLAVSKAAGRLSSILPVAERLLGRSGLYVTIKGMEWEWELQDYTGGIGLFASEQLESGKGVLLLFGRGEGADQGVSRETTEMRPDNGKPRK